MYNIGADINAVVGVHFINSFSNSEYFVEVHMPALKSLDWNKAI